MLTISLKKSVCIFKLKNWDFFLQIWLIDIKRNYDDYRFKSGFRPKPDPNLKFLQSRIRIRKKYSDPKFFCSHRCSKKRIIVILIVYHLIRLNNEFCNDTSYCPITPGEIAFSYHFKCYFVFLLQFSFGYRVFLLIRYYYLKV